MFANYAFDFLKDHLKNVDTNYLEIGVYNGDAIASLAQTYAQKKIFAIDPFIEDVFTTHNSGVNRGSNLSQQHKNTIENIRGLSNISLFEMTSEKFADSLTTKMVTDMNIGTVFIDGSHHYHDVVVDYILALKLLNNRSGVICFNDLHTQDVSTACNEFAASNINIITQRVDINSVCSAFFISSL